MENNQSQHVQKWTNSGTGTNRSTLPQLVVEASKGMKLMYVKDLRKQFTALLAKLKVVLGLSSEMMPTGEEIEVMLNYALDNWYNQTIEEIELAVICNMNHENETYVDCYGKLSIKFLTDCLYHYRETKRKAILDHKRREESMKSRTHDVEPDEVVNFKLWDGLCKFVREQGRIPEIWDWTRCYDHLEAENGEGWLSIDEKLQIYAEQTAIFEAKQQKSKQQAQTVAELREITDSDSERAIKIACKRFVVERELRKHLPESN